MDIIVNSSFAHLWEQVPQEEELSNYYLNILSCLGYPADNPPVADLLRRYHQLEGDWLIVSPIHWQATHNDAMIMASDSALDLSDEESRRWCAALAEFLAQDKIKLYYHDAYTWLIHFDECPPLHAMPVHTLLQKSMMPQLQALDTTLFWTRFITENQMFFSEHPLNKARAGRHPINGVWIWGGGALTELPHVRTKSKRSRLCERSEAIQRSVLRTLDCFTAFAKTKKWLAVKPQGNRLLVCGDEAACDLAALLSTQVCPYQPDQSYSKDAILLFSEFDYQQACQFENNTVHWHWNNTTYVTRPKSWLARLLRR